MLTHYLIQTGYYRSPCIYIMKYQFPNYLLKNISIGQLHQHWFNPVLKWQGEVKKEHFILCFFLSLVLTQPWAERWEYVASKKMKDDKFFQVNRNPFSGSLPSLKLFYSSTGKDFFLSWKKLKQLKLFCVLDTKSYDFHILCKSLMKILHVS